MRFVEQRSSLSGQQRNFLASPEIFAADLDEMSKRMKPGYIAFGSVFISLLLVVGALDQVRADNTLEADGKHETAIPEAPYFTSTAQPAMLAINGGTIQSTDNTNYGSPPWRSDRARSAGDWKSDHRKESHHSGLGCGTSRNLGCECHKWRLGKPGGW